MQVKLGKVEITVKHGSITREKVDAIVNAANSHMLMGGGVAGAIKRDGGKEIEAEALKHAPVPIGEAVRTNGGMLPARYVIHAPTMEYPGPTDEANVRAATKAALECAERIKAETIALPGMGTGVGGLSEKKSAQVIVQTIKTHIAAGTQIKKIILIDVNQSMVEQFENAI